jgi:hypothetical protein
MLRGKFFLEFGLFIVFDFCDYVHMPWVSCHRTEEITYCISLALFKVVGEVGTHEVEPAWLKTDDAVGS